MTVTALQIKPKDVRAASRARRYRERKNSKEINVSVTVRDDLGVTTSVTISTPEVCSLAARLTGDIVTVADLQLAERIIMTFVDHLPPDSIVQLR